MTDREKVFLMLGASRNPQVAIDICNDLGIPRPLVEECLKESISFQRVASWRWDGSKYATDRFDSLT